MLVFHTPLSLTHDPPKEILSGCAQPYFESPARVTRILSALLDPECRDGSEFEERCCDWTREEVASDAALLQAVARVHDPVYLDFLREIYAEWIEEGGSKDAALPETFLRRDLLLEPDHPARNYSVDAIARIGYRPPGHHATDTLCGGYCYLNNAAVAARQFQHDRGTKAKVAILDIDYHHGNGTSKIFYNDPSVLYVSLHAWADYPYYTGAEQERGGPDAKGMNINYPLTRGCSNDMYIYTLLKAVNDVRRFAPELLIVSLGVDTYSRDPITEFCITLETYPEIGRTIAQIERPTLFVMEGGYCMDAIGGCVRSVLAGFQEEAHELAE
ncbi:Arginase/deacetylase [Rhodotorula sp. JG-1b]|nr:Arginase/deacetylase [Rhodotorula sp. JG-1b]